MRHFVSLRQGSRFGSIYRSGRRRRSGGITVIQSRGPLLRPEVGFVAGKSVGNAVQRNRAKRRLREIADVAGLQSHTAYVVVASPEVLDAEYNELCRWMTDAVAIGATARDEDR